MNWDVKIYLAKIKDGKGKEFAFCVQENFAYKNPAKIPLTGYFLTLSGTVICGKYWSMRWKEFVSEYLRFSKRDRIGTLALFICIFIIFLFPHLLPQRSSIPVADNDSMLVASIGRVKNDKEKEVMGGERAMTAYNSIGHSLFYFDPNSISLEDWKKLGLNEKTIHTIINYRNKGGRFRTTDDLKKIYGLREGEFNRISAYIRIENRSAMKKEPAIPPTVSNEPGPTITKPLSRQKYASIDINLSDTTAWIALPGIGSKLASRIVNFREKLGGFYSIEQVAETFGLPDSTFQKIRSLLQLGPVEIKKISINSVSPEELRKHPYIRWALANAIIAYRNEHGVFKQLEELKNIMAITEGVYNKIRNYLTL